jgi:hypothetical protein
MWPALSERYNERLLRLSYMPGRDFLDAAILQSVLHEGINQLEDRASVAGPSLTMRRIGIKVVLRVSRSYALHTHSALLF